MTRFACFATLTVCCRSDGNWLRRLDEQSDTASAPRDSAARRGHPWACHGRRPPNRPGQRPPDRQAAASGSGGRLISPHATGLQTTGSTWCLWLPTRLTVLSRTAIRIDMRSPHTRCLADYIGRPIAVTINPRIVNVHRPLIVRPPTKRTTAVNRPRPGTAPSSPLACSPFALRGHSGTLAQPRVTPPCWSDERPSLAHPSPPRGCRRCVAARPGQRA